MALFRSLALMGLAIVTAGMMPAQYLFKKKDLKEVRDYRLDMVVIQRYIQALRNVSGDPAARKCFGDYPPGIASTLNAGENLINACPSALAGLRTAGIKPREFFILTKALTEDYTTVLLKRNGIYKQYPDSISPENAAFIEQNFDTVGDLLAPMMQR